MEKIIIIGNSKASFQALTELIKGTEPKAITLITEERHAPYERALLLNYLAGKVQDNDIFYAQEDFYAKNNINLKLGTDIARVDTKKQRVILKDNLKLEYDNIFIAHDGCVELPDIPGNTKEGVYAFSTLEDAKEIKEKLGIVKHISIWGEAENCFLLYQALSTFDKEIKIISSPKPRDFTNNEKAEWIDSAFLSELIGEGSELKAVKLSNGKVIGTDLAVFCAKYTPKKIINN